MSGKETFGKNYMMQSFDLDHLIQQKPSKRTAIEGYVPKFRIPECLEQIGDFTIYIATNKTMRCLKCRRKTRICFLFYMIIHFKYFRDSLEIF